MTRQSEYHPSRARYGVRVGKCSPMPALTSTVEPGVGRPSTADSQKSWAQSEAPQSITSARTRTADEWARRGVAEWFLMAALLCSNDLPTDSESEAQIDFSRTRRPQRDLCRVELT